MVCSRGLNLPPRLHWGQQHRQQPGFRLWWNHQNNLLKLKFKRNATMNQCFLYMDWNLMWIYMRSLHCHLQHPNENWSTRPRRPFLGSSQPPALRQGKSWSTASRFWQNWFGTKTRSYSRSGSLTAKSGVGTTHSTDTNMHQKSGPTWWFCLIVMSHMAHACWKLRSSTTLRVSWCTKSGINNDVEYAFLFCSISVFPKRMVKKLKDLYITIPWHMIRGIPGCKNVRLGGDTPPSLASKTDRFMTYVVYRSLKHPPPVKTCVRS